MSKDFKFRPVPPHFADRFPDGNYTVGRGADPRGPAEKAQDAAAAKVAEASKPHKPKRAKKPLRPAAE